MRTRRSALSRSYATLQRAPPISRALASRRPTATRMLGRSSSRVGRTGLDLRPRHLTTIAVAVVLLCLAFTPSAGAAPAAAPLPELPGAGYSSAQSINSRGDIAGYSGTADGSAHEVLWTDGAGQDLGTVAGDANSY